MTLISEIEDALVSAYYGNPGAFQGSAMVGLSVTENADDYGSAFANNAMVAAFGGNWKSVLKLRYDGWESSKNVETSTFQGKEAYLLERLDDLAQSLTDSTDNTTVGYSGVLYVANNTANLSAEQQAALITAIKKAPASGGMSNVLTDINNNAFGGQDFVSSAAALYALVEAYADYSGQTVDLTFDGTETPESAAAKIITAFHKLARGGGTDKLNKYFAEQVEQDMKAYLEIMRMVNNAKSQVIGNLDKLGTTGGPTWESSYSDLFANYTNGGVFVFLKLDENGTPMVDTSLAES